MGKQHGLGIYRNPDEELKYGIWIMGKRIKWFTAEEI